MEDHANSREYLQKAQARLASKGLFASAVAEGIYSTHEDLEEDYEEFADVVTEYLMKDHSSADERALKLMEIEDTVDEVLEKNRKITRRRFLGGAALVGGLAAGGALLGSNSGDSTQQQEDYVVNEATINNTAEIGNYLEGLTSRMQEEWSALVNVYDEESGEFFPDQDINLNGVDIRYREDPDIDSDYRINSEIEGNLDRSDWQPFEHDETAEDALEHFGELDE